jgi:pyruvate,water dikinase
MAWLLRHGFRVPETWVIPASESFEVAAWLPDDGPWAVRSSAAVEDGFESSYAGQFATVLDASGPAEVTDAIQTVRRSASDPTVKAYRHRMRDDQPVAMAVIVQRMIQPRSSGVAFSRNPMTGLSEIVIEAVAGRGDALVADGVTPERWITRWGEWNTQPTERSVLSERLASEIASETARIADAFGSPVDLEWVWDGHDVWWVQVRPITGLGRVNVYSNRISREVMPGMIKPLVWSVNVPVVNSAWIDLFEEVIGPNDLRPEQLAKQFAYRSYFDMGTIGEIFELLGMPRDALEMLLGLPSEAKPRFRPSAGTVRHLPRIIGAAIRKLRYGSDLTERVTTLEREFSEFNAVELEALSDSGLFDHLGALALVARRAASVNIVTPLLANAYVSLLRRSLTRKGLDPSDVDVELGAEANPHDPNRALARLGAMIAETGDETIESVRVRGVEALPGHLAPVLAELLEAHGHVSFSGNDFSVPPWSERPDAVLRMAIDHVAVTGSTRALPWRDATSRLGPVTKRTIAWIQARASDFVAHREHVSSVYTYGYGLFRPAFLEAGRRLVDRDVLDAPEDVMFLEFDELRAELLSGGGAGIARELVELRRRDMADLADVEMPETIFGDDFVPVRRSPVDVDQVCGVATSRGRHRGTLRVVMDIDDAHRVEPGDVIAIPFSDVGWTPLFARAGAVIAEAGGMLSHSSIVAREYLIPCVVSVPRATALPDGATVVVDGYTGTISIERP